MKNLIEKFFDEILYQRIISRAVERLLSFAPQRAEEVRQGDREIPVCCRGRHGAADAVKILKDYSLLQSFCDNILPSKATTHRAGRFFRASVA